NEMYGGWQIGNMNAHDYVKKARAFAMVMKRTDPSIQLIGCGQNGWSEWDEITLSGLAEVIDFHSIHLYTGGPDHYATVFQSHQAERAIRICAALIERVRYALTPDQESPSGRVHNVGDLGPFTLVDASATCDEAGRAMAVALVNRDRDHDLPVTLDLGGAVIAGAVSAWEVNGADVTATN